MSDETPSIQIQCKERHPIYPYGRCTQDWGHAGAHRTHHGTWHIPATFDNTATATREYMHAAAEHELATLRATCHRLQVEQETERATWQVIRAGLLDNTHAAESAMERYKQDLSTLRQQQAETQQELAAERRHIKILEHALIEHSEFGGLFQPGGKYHGIAPLRLGTSAVVEGGKWLDAQYTTLQASLRSLVAQWRDLAASAYWPSAIRFADQLAALVPLPPQEETNG